MKVLVTGAAGFIGSHLADALLSRGDEVLGIDDLGGDDRTLKEARLARLAGRDGFRFEQIDIADDDAVDGLDAGGARKIVHLAAQAGVRRSIVEPRACVRANLLGQINMLELARRLGVEHFVYASSSSVYGVDSPSPHATSARAERPVSLYAATKRANELLVHSYGELHGLAATGLRYFTVYGPWGRPDMAPAIFTRAILGNEPIPVFNQGALSRDFTYVDDIVAGTLGALDREGGGHRVYNLGNSRTEPLLRFISVLERAIGRKAEIEYLPMQSGDVEETRADITESTRDLGYLPTTSIDEGLPRFVDWYRRYHGV